ncbi:MAG: DUF4176 domain-containing protein [Oscillospiraceae bacterium]|nr:DUF4176 domain-containing protein [Oscillospiraceae bacterium]
MNFLPIGSVVILNDGSQPVMIYGRKQINTNDGKAWDYVGCLYPEGNLGDEYNVFFNNEDIGEILFVGFQTKIELQLQEILNRA